MNTTQKVLILVSIFLVVSLGIISKMSFDVGREGALKEVEEKVTRAKEEGRTEGRITGVRRMKNEMYNHLRMYGVVAVDFLLPLEEGEELEDQKVLRIFLEPKTNE